MTHHSQSRSSVNFQVCAILGVRKFLLGNKGETSWETSRETSWGASWETSWLGDKRDKTVGGGRTPQQRETRRKTNWYTSWETNGTRTWEGGQTIQQREKRRETWETRGKTDTPPNKGKQEQRPAGRQAGRQGLGKTRGPSKKRKQEGKQAGRRTPKGTRIKLHARSPRVNTSKIRNFK